MTINNKSERSYRGKCLGWPVTSYGADCSTNSHLRHPSKMEGHLWASTIDCPLLHGVCLLANPGNRAKSPHEEGTKQEPATQMKKWNKREE